MTLAIIDWIIIAFYIVFVLAVSLYMYMRGGSTTGDFFLSGRKLPWYIAGTGMVATTFAADTPLAVTELVAQHGVAGNWLWWNMLFGGMLTVFFFSRLWRRANILTDAEFVSIRYAGRAAHFLRGFRAVYIGIAMNSIVIAWVNLAMVKILKVVFPSLTVFGYQSFDVFGLIISSQLAVVAAMLVFVVLYSSVSGLRGVSFIDTTQFAIAMGGSIALAIYAVDEVGGVQALQTKLAGQSHVFDFFPAMGTGGQTAAGVLQMGGVAIIAYLGVQWWASWYPGAEPGGGGYIAQRMMSAKDERHSLLATLWFQVAHYAIRPWPWILVALATLVLYPGAPDPGAAYVMVIRDFLPPGLTGLLLAAFLAAYMSTVASQIVWGTSYIVNDLYRPFVKPDGSERYYVRVSRWATVLLMLFSVLITTQFDQISDAWKFILTCSGGIGLVLLLRWFWWRVNAWSEISAMIAPYFIYPVLKYYFNTGFELTLIIIVLWSTIVWLLVTWLTPAESQSTLEAFYRRVHPGGAGWRRIARAVPEVKGDKGFVRLFVNWGLGCVLVLFMLFAIGSLIFGHYTAFALYLLVAMLAGGGIYFNLKHIVLF